VDERRRGVWAFLWSTNVDAARLGQAERGRCRGVTQSVLASPSPPRGRGCPHHAPSHGVGGEAGKLVRMGPFPHVGEAARASLALSPTWERRVPASTSSHGPSPPSGRGRPHLVPRAGGEAGIPPLVAWEAATVFDDPAVPPVSQGEVGGGPFIKSSRLSIEQRPSLLLSLPVSGPGRG